MFSKKLHMKKILFVLTTLLSLSATAQIKMPAASPTQTLIQDFGLGKIGKDQVENYAERKGMTVKEIEANFIGFIDI